MARVTRSVGAAALAMMAAILLCGSMPAARAAEPIKIGFGMALTGGIAANGKAALLSMQIWAKDINAKGGLLGRPVELVYYDDQSNASMVPGIYTKLLDIDKVDLVASGYGTNLIAPAMPIVMQRNLVFMGLFGLAVNDEFRYPNYFSVMPTGPEPKTDFSKGFFDIATEQQPKPHTVAIASADAEFARNAADGARTNAKKAGFDIVYDRTYPPTTVDFSPIVRGIQASNPDIVYIASYPPDTVGIIRAANEIGLKTKLFGGGMVGLPYASLKTQLGPLLNGIVYYDTYVPEPTLKFPGIQEFLQKYQAQAAQAGTDPLGFYLPPFAYADLQILGDAVTATGGLDQAKIGAYIREHTFSTIVGDIRFAPNGEWATSRVLQVQFQGVKGNDLEQFRKPGTQVIIRPKEWQSGKLLYPYSDVAH